MGSVPRLRHEEGFLNSSGPGIQYPWIYSRRQKASGDPGHSGLSVGVSSKEAKVTLDGNSTTGKGSRPPRSEIVGSSA